MPCIFSRVLTPIFQPILQKKKLRLGEEARLSPSLPHSSLCSENSALLFQIPTRSPLWASDKILVLGSSHQTSPQVTMVMGKYYAVQESWEHESAPQAQDPGGLGLPADRRLLRVSARQDALLPQEPAPAPPADAALRERAGHE